MLGIKYEFDMARMTLIAENMLWRRGRNKVDKREEFR
jgi:hypothetical protein